MEHRHSFTDETTVTIPGSTHGLGTGPMLIKVYSAAPDARPLYVYETTIDPVTHDVTLDFCYLTLAPETDAGFVETRLPPQTGVVILHSD